MSDLDKLIAAVEAGGDVPRPLYLAIPAHADIPTRHLAARIINNGKDMTAALGIHEALLPGWIWNVVDSETTVWPGYPGDPKDRQDGYCEGNPARAWLLAILRALAAGKGDAG